MGIFVVTIEKRGDEPVGRAYKEEEVNVFAEYKEKVGIQTTILIVALMEGRCPAETTVVKIESEDYLEQLLHKGVLFYENVNCDQQQECEQGSSPYPPLVNNVHVSTFVIIK
ncbi:unnamed protein product, partial [Timema podura]|nr:unnamed protein product [Timema podura]